MLMKDKCEKKLTLLNEVYPNKALSLAKIYMWIFTFMTQ